MKKSENFPLRLPLTLIDDLKEEAKTRNIKASAFARYVLEHWFKNTVNMDSEPWKVVSGNAEIEGVRKSPDSRITVTVNQKQP